jgi:hypothetical protein
LKNRNRYDKIDLEESTLKKYDKRFEELEDELVGIESTRRLIPNSMFRNAESVDQELLDEWRVKAKNLIVSVCGKDSEHYKDFIESEKTVNLDTSCKKYLRLKAVFHAAKEDYLGGYLLTVRNLVQAELFNDELEQARELLGKGYYIAAAVIAGVVLETRIRQLCIDNNIETGKLNKMNEDLAKAGIYNALIQKQILALAGIRNSAAHGKTDEFNTDHVKNMIKEIETLLAYNFGS